jgi:hypothetical protein
MLAEPLFVAAPYVLDVADDRILLQNDHRFLSLAAATGDCISRNQVVLGDHLDSVVPQNSALATVFVWDRPQPAHHAAVAPADAPVQANNRTVVAKRRNFQQQAEFVAFLRSSSSSCLSSG